jgi:hypothetical protein
MVEQVGSLEGDEPYRNDKCAGCGKNIWTNLTNPVYCMKCEDMKAEVIR